MAEKRTYPTSEKAVPDIVTRPPAKAPLSRLIAALPLLHGGDIGVARGAEMVAAELDQPRPVAGLERGDHRPMLGAGQRQMRGAGRRDRTGAMNLLRHHLDQLDEMRIAACGKERLVKRHIGAEGRARVGVSDRGRMDLL